MEIFRLRLTNFWFPTESKDESNRNARGFRFVFLIHVLDFDPDDGGLQQPSPTESRGYAVHSDRFFSPNVPETPETLRRSVKSIVSFVRPPTKFRHLRVRTLSCARGALVKRAIVEREPFFSPRYFTRNRRVRRNGQKGRATAAPRRFSQTRPASR